MTKFSSLIDYVLKIIGISYIFLTIASFVDLKIYYGYFGVSISEYITPSEIIFLALDKSLLLFIVLLLQLLFWLYNFKYLFGYNLKESLQDGERRPKVGHDETIYRFFRNKHLKLFFILGSIVMLATTIISAFFPENIFLRSVMVFCLLNCWVTLLLYMGFLQSTRRVWMLLKKNKNYALPLLTFILFTIVFATSVWIKNFLLFNRVRKYNSEKNVELLLNNDAKIGNDKTLKYIGQTQSHIFYWDRSTEEVSVYPISEIKKIVIRK